jgi:hypothetical protein
MEFILGLCGIVKIKKKVNGPLDPSFKDNDYRETLIK